MAVAVCACMSVGTDVEEGNAVGDGDRVASCIPVAVGANAAASSVDGRSDEVQPASKNTITETTRSNVDLTCVFILLQT